MTYSLMGMCCRPQLKVDFDKVELGMGRVVEQKVEVCGKSMPGVSAGVGSIYC